VYELVYDAANGNPETWPFMPISLLVILFGAFLTFSETARSAFSRGRSKKLMLIFSRVLFGGAVLLTLLSGCSTFSKTKEAKLSSLDNTCTLIEGKVVNFKPRASEGGQNEKFKVNNITFEYSDYVFTGGFNNTASHGGPIYEGLKVRLCYFDRSNPNAYISRSRPDSRVIVRLEVSR